MKRVNVWWLVAVVALSAVSHLLLFRQCLYFARENQSIMEEYAAFVREQEALLAQMKAQEVEIERLQRAAVKAIER